ncbi:MAG: ABC transporter permease subunit, partial [Victivallales bacterium]|nr:ABC transporter permease subunit [Victivallales bacterium]
MNSITAGLQSLWTSFAEAFQLNFIQDNRWEYLSGGFIKTIEISFFAVLLGLLLGFTVAVIRATHDRTNRLKFLNFLCKVYLTVIRGTPAVVQLLIIYFVILKSCDNKVLVAIIAFGVNSGAYVAEIIRGGIMS